MTAPFFSNPGLLRARFAHLAIDEQAVAEGLAGVPVGEVAAILAGHSHYDHLGDLPHVAELAGRAALYVNRSGAHALAAVPELEGRLRVFEDEAGRWIELADAAGRRLPIRVLPLASGHAPHVGPLSFFKGEIEEDWQPPWSAHRFASLRGGTSFAFVVELLDERGEAAGRLFLQDSASAEGLDRLPPGPYDLAVLCMASAQTVKPYPRDVLARVRPRHVLVTHYESFFRHPSRPLRLVPLLYGWRAARFLRWTNEALASAGVVASKPLAPPCGPSRAGWTLPLPGEWIELAAGAATEERSR
jgi:glyoxylase-like metal-dependent hydrolase (beta-lactamase superfamily II)